MDQNTNNKPIIVEQDYDVDASTVWKAITNLEEMRQWYFPNIPAFEAVIGFETAFDVTCEDRHFRHLWKITEVVPEKKIAYDWAYAEYPGACLVTFELIDEGARTKLRLTCDVKEPFPQDIPEFKRESGVAGWNYFIGESLSKHLNNTSS